MAIKLREISGRIQEVDDKGQGLIEVDGRRILLRGGHRGEYVTGRVLRKKRGFLMGDILEVHTPSQSRNEDACPYFPRCGGCALQHVSSLDQRHRKDQIVQNLLAEHGVQPDDWQMPQGGDTKHYRTRARLGVRCVGGEVLVGFRESFSSRVARQEHCSNLAPPFDQLLGPLRELIGQLSEPSSIPQLETICGARSNAMIVRHLRELTHADRSLLAEFERAHVIKIILQSGGYDTLLGLDGSVPEALTYDVDGAGTLLEFSPWDFTQVNWSVNRKMIQAILAALEEIEPNLTSRAVLDLFCGIGNISLPLASSGYSVHGVELSATAIDSAKRNAVRLSLSDNASFEVRDIYQEPLDLGRFEVVICDPPRSGLGSELLEQLNLFPGSFLFYISCNPKTFAEDAGELIRQGYKLNKGHLFDMFPNTAHVESFGVFERVCRG